MAYISPATNRAFLRKTGALGGNYNKRPKVPTTQSKIPGGLPNFNDAPGVAATGAVAPSFGGVQKPTAAPQLGGGGEVGGASSADPRDPTYWTDIAKINQTFQGTMSGLDLQETKGRTTLTNALAGYDKAEPIDISNARGSYNNSGLFYSTRLGQAEGGIVSKYGAARTDARQGFNDLLSGIDIERGTQRATYGPGGTAYGEAFNNAAGRQTDRDTTSANNNALASLASAIAGNQSGNAPGGFESPAYGPAAAAAGVSPANWVKTTYMSAKGNPVRVYGDGRKEIQVNGTWRAL